MTRPSSILRMSRISLPLLLLLPFARAAAAQQTPGEVVEAALAAIEDERYEDAVVFVDSAALEQYRDQYVLGRLQGWPFKQQEVRIDPGLPQCVQDYLRAESENRPPFHFPEEFRQRMLLGLPDVDSVRALSPRALLVRAMQLHAQRQASMPSPNGIPSRQASVVLGEVIEGERAYVLVEQIHYQGGYAMGGSSQVATVPLTRRDGSWRIGQPMFLAGEGDTITLGWSSMD